jgi:DNA polymerase III alpha subunit
VVNKRVLEGLITAGALILCIMNRAQLLSGVELALEFGNKVQNSKVSAADSLFGNVQNEVKISEPNLPAIGYGAGGSSLQGKEEYLDFM